MLSETWGAQMLGTRSAERLNIVRWRLIFVGAQYGTYYYYYLLQLSFHSVTVVLTLITNKNKFTYTQQYKNTVQTIQHTVNTSTHITKTPKQLSKHPHIHTPTHYKPSPPHTHTHTHTSQNKFKQPQYKTHTK